MFWPDLSQAPFHRALAMFDAGRPSPRINIAGARSGPASTGIRSPGADRPASSGRHAVRPWYWPRYTGMRIGPTENRNGAPRPPYYLMLIRFRYLRWGNDPATVTSTC